MIIVNNSHATEITFRLASDLQGLENISPFISYEYYYYLPYTIKY